MENKRKVLFTHGMSNDKMLIITDAPKEKIENWCRRYISSLADGTYGTEVTLFDSLKKDFYVKLLHDNEMETNCTDIDIIGYDEVFDFSDFQHNNNYVMKVTCPNCGKKMHLWRLEHDECNPEGFYTSCTECGASFDIDFSPTNTFITDVAKMADFKVLTKEDFLSSYSYMNEKEYESTRLYLNWLNADDSEP